MFDLMIDEIKALLEKIGGEPGSKNWEIVTAFFGWGALFFLIVVLIGSFLGFYLPSFILGATGYILFIAKFFFSIALKRDFKKLRKSKKP